LIKSLIVKINRIKLYNNSEQDRRKDIHHVIILSIAAIILIILIIFPISIAIVPNILSGLPVMLRIFIIFGFFIIYVPIYACFFGLFRGLGDVVGAGGSASMVIKQLQEYIYEALEIKQEKQDNNTKK
jgi:hypothetical protein